MAIYKAVVHSEYAQIPNSTLQDSSISFEARGVLAMLLSMPAHWQVHKSWVVSQSSAGKDKVSSIFKELEDSGYIRREEGQRKHGKFSSDDYFVFPNKSTVADLPQRSSRSGSAVDGEPDTRKETSLENKQLENKHLKTCATESHTPDNLLISFDMFWQAGMKKVNKKKALSAYKTQFKANKKNLGDSDQEINFANYLANDIKKRLDLGQLGFSEMHPTTYLNGERWNDDYPEPRQQLSDFGQPSVENWAEGLDQEFHGMNK